MTKGQSAEAPLSDSTGGSAGNEEDTEEEGGGEESAFMMGVRAHERASFFLPPFSSSRFRRRFSMRQRGKILNIKAHDLNVVLARETVEGIEGRRQKRIER